MDKQRSVVAIAYAVKRVEVKLEWWGVLNVLRREQRAAVDAIFGLRMPMPFCT